MAFPICPVVVSNKAKGVGDRGLWKKHEKLKKKIKFGKKNMKFGTLNRHKVGQIRSYRAVDKWIRRRILRSFICDGSQGLILSKNSDFFQTTFKI